MGSSTEELSGEIASTRNRMASDIDALQDKVSPSAIVQRRKEAARGRMVNLRNKVMGTAHDARSSVASTTSSATGSVQGAAHGVADKTQDALGTAQEKVEGSPLAAGLVAFGAGVVLAGLIPASSKEAQAASAVAETIKDKGAPLLEEAKSVGQDIGQDLKEAATEAADQVKQTAAEGAGHVKEEGQSAAESVRSDAQGGTGQSSGQSSTGQSSTGLGTSGQSSTGLGTSGPGTGTTY